MQQSTATLLVDSAPDRAVLERNHPSGAAGVLLARRYIAIEGGPRFTWISEFESPDALTSALSWSGAEVAPGVPDVARRLYRSRNEDLGGSAEEAAACRYLGASSMTVDPDHEAELHSWYLEEHIPGLLKIDGWVRSRRFELVAGQGPAQLALHNMRDLSVRRHSDFDAIMTTPWRRRIMDLRTAYDRKLLELEG